MPAKHCKHGYSKLEKSKSCFLIFVFSFNSPCFDEPGYKATFKLTLNHPAGSTALSNTVGTRTVNGATATTTFATTEKLPTYLFGFTIFKDSDFSSVTKKSASGKDVRFRFMLTFKLSALAY